MASENGTRSIAPEPTHEEAAAIIAAVERFSRATAAPAQAAQATAGEWQQAALAEAVERSPAENLRDPWINT